MSRKLAIHLLFVFLGLGAGVLASVHPWKVWSEQRHRTDEQLARMRSAEQAQEELLRRASRIHTNLGREEMARAVGWVKPGETPG